MPAATKIPSRDQHSCVKTNIHAFGEKGGNPIFNSARKRSRRHQMRYSVLGFAALLIALISPSSFALDLVVPSDPVLRGDSLSVEVRGVKPSERVSITAERMLGSPAALFRSRAIFTADESGTVRTDSDPAMEGSYKGVDEAGLFWSMVRVDGARGDIPAGAVIITAIGADGTVSEARLQVIDAAPVIQEKPVDAFPGAILYRLPDAAVRPAIIVLGGSEGGASHARDIGPALASRGYAVLGLPYYSPHWGQGREIEALSASFIDIPVEQIARARDWLRRDPGIAADTIGLWGVSKGAEFVLLAASEYPWIAAAAAIVPSDVVWEGWGPDSQGYDRHASFSIGGQGLSFVPYEDADLYFGAFEKGERPTITLVDVHVRGRTANADRVAAARIPIERYRGDLLVAGGAQDTIWPSADMTKSIVATRSAAGLPTEVFVYDDAGHGLAGPGFVPTIYYGSGGTPAANGRAQVEIWRAALNMFARTLNPPGR